MKNLIDKVVELSRSRGFYEEGNTTATAQKLGAIGELFEFREAYIKGYPRCEQLMELGDIFYFAINWASMLDIGSSTMTYHINCYTPIDFKINDSVESIIDRSRLSVGFYEFIHHTVLLPIKLNSTFEECLLLAYEKNLKRKGEFKNGKWVKESDL